MKKFLRSKTLVIGAILVAAPLVGAGLALLPDRIASLDLFAKPDPGKAAELAFDNCSLGRLAKGMTQENCYANEMAKVAQAQGGDFAFAALGDLQRLDSNTVGCHFIAHGIGYGVYKRDPAHWRESVSTVNPGCSYGAIHGIIEQYVLTNLPGGKFDPKMLPSICGDSPRADCNHILGHLTLVFTKGNIDQALTDCKVFKDAEQRFQCDTGVFMEEQTAVNLIAHGLADQSWNDWAARTPELTQMCRDQTVEEYINACWQEVTHAALVKMGNDVGQLFDFCDSAQTKEAAGYCKEHGLGIVSVADGKSLKELGSICELSQVQRDSFVDKCYQTLLSSVLATSQDRLGEAVAFCGTLSGKVRANCFGSVGSMARSFGSGKICGGVGNAADRTACEKGPTESVKITSD